MSVEPKLYEQAKTYLENFDDYFFTTTLKADERKHFTDKWFAARASVLSLNTMLIICYAIAMTAKTTMKRN